MKRAFTLIELLVCVAVLLILAAIAIPHLVAGQTRAKVSRAQADLRTLSVAIEAYTADTNQTPRMAHYTFYGDSNFDVVQGERVNGVSSKALSTPVAYLASPFFLDPFMTGRNDIALDERLYTYQVIPVYIEKNPDSNFWPAALDFYGPWRLASVGPDQSFNHFFVNSSQLPYDPTNGTVSAGNIWRSPKNNATMPFVPDLLGEH